MERNQMRLNVLRTMIASRVFEERLGEEFAKQRAHARGAFGGRNGAFEEHNLDFRVPIQGNIELSIGQEAAPAALCAWLTTRDYAAGTHRSHSLAIAKGVDQDRLLAELYGRSTGLCAGRSGDFMLNDSDVNFENSAIMAQLTGVALGHAFAYQRQASDTVAAVFIGDGASNQGIVHESMNLASLWKLPVIFVIEDNGYAISTPRHRASSMSDLSARATAYGMPGISVDDKDVDRLIASFEEAVSRARHGRGPSLVVSRTRRLRGAFEGDNQSYRPTGELEAAQAQDGLIAYSELLADEGVIDREWIDAVTLDAQHRFDSALEFAETSPYPEPSDALRGLFA